ncbi:MAG: hypothetical protein HUJ31_10595, partial [Pseudomonadales bacterium]|nr:hypothetical protein [Pseudomonadales bacterium]
MLTGLVLFSVVAFAGSPPVSTALRPDGSRVDYYLKNIEEEPDKSVRPLLLILQGSDCNSVANLNIIDDYAAIAPDLPVLLIEKYGITNEL